MASGKIYNPENVRGHDLSSEQRAFEKWARRHSMSMRRNFYVAYHDAPFTYEELFGDITADDYYSEDKTQGAWDGWRGRGKV